MCLGKKMNRRKKLDIDLSTCEALLEEGDLNLFVMSPLQKAKK